MPLLGLHQEVKEEAEAEEEEVKEEEEEEDEDEDGEEYELVPLDEDDGILLSPMSERDDYSPEDREVAGPKLPKERM